jgi:Ni2+-binding GTPase involved in maturation of urease and hydrogenase
MGTVNLVFVGGFLGAGKTTLLYEAARRLVAQGRRVGLITNDQAPDLVDTTLLAGRGLEVREVAGSCFCCNFPGLIGAADQLTRQGAADILLAEPVGSCTDLSATILQPLKDKFAGPFLLAPLSVLADPARLREVLSGKGDTLHPSAAYILRKQLEEADRVVINKTDTLSAPELADLQALAARELPGIETCAISARTGQGVDEWLAAVLAGGEAGRRIADVDYDIYAAGEAVLGWLNAAITLTSSDPEIDWRRYALSLIENLRQACVARRADVGHIKLIVTAPAGALVANLTRTHEEPQVRGEIGGAPAEVRMVLNARVAVPPEELERMVRAALAAAACTGTRIDVTHLQSLRPGRPQPTHRYGRVV